jgi:dTDP-4-dehydrorhamnose reductase
LVEATMRIVVTGSTGLFGYGIARVFGQRHTVIALTRADADITNAAQVRAAITNAKPEIVIHPAGIPDLDVCEADPALAHAVNVEGTRHVTDAARAVGAAVAYISTDAVFDGLKRTPYIESDPTNPPTVYGCTKLLGEEIVLGLPNHWIFRVSLLFGPRKKNFVEKCLNAIAAEKEYVATEDQLGSATYTLDAVSKIREVVEARRYGLFHLSNAGACSRVEIARRAAELAGLDAGKVIGKPMDEMGRRAKRLKYAVMEMDALKQAGFALPRPWQEALAEYVRTWHSNP